MAEGKFKVYKSSAGSGKTFTLVKEFLRICLTSVDLYGFSRILAITFTNKATYEMKHRIVQALKQIGEGDKKGQVLSDVLVKETGLDQEELALRCSKILTAILHSYADFGISTIDKFTHRVIRTFAKDLQLSPIFKVELDETKVLREVIDLIIDKVGVDEEITDLILRFALTRMEEEKTWKIDRELLDFAQDILKEKSIPYLKALRNLKPEDYQITIKEYKRYIKKFENEVQTLARKAYNLIQENGIEHASFAGRSKISKFFENLATGFFEKIEPTQDVWNNLEKDNWFSGKCPVGQKVLIEGIKTDLLDAFNKIDAIKKERYSTYIAAIEILKPIYNLSLLNHIEQKLAAYKKQEKLLNISDFNQMISGIVEREPMPFIYERLGDRYHHIMIDEFQDTSVLQFANLLPLVEDSLSRGQENLIVGDAKQAIYRFRGGEVEQFSEMPHYQLADNQESYLYEERMQTLAVQYQEEFLTQNFRSLPVLVDFNNAFFEFAKQQEELTPKISNIFKEHQQQSLASKTGGYVNLCFVIGKGEEKALAYQEEVLRAIEECLADGYSLKDMAVLVRKKKDARAIAERLKLEGVEVLSSEALLLKNDASVNFVLSFAQWVFQPQVHLYQKEIVEYLVLEKRLEGSLDENLVKYTRKGMIEQLLSDLAIELNLEQLKLKASHEFFEAIVRAFQLNREYNIYLQFLQDVVLDYFKANKATLPQFLLWWEENQDQFSISSSEGLNAVSIMTIHKSKGLEFPVTILPYAQQKIAYSGPLRKNYIWTETIKSPATPLKYAMVEYKSELKESDLSEAHDEELAKTQIDFMNDVYVAFTRASERMYIISEEQSAGSRANRSLNLPDLLSEFAFHLGKEADEKGAFSFGERVAKPPQKSKEESSLTLHYQSEPWNKKLRISRTSLTEWKQSEPIQYGVMMHEILGELEDISDLEAILKSYQLHGNFSPEEFQYITQKLTHLLNQEAIAVFFDGKNKSKREADLLSKEGKLLRPDRVVYLEDTVAVLDYKTGEKNEAHHQQVNEYLHALANTTKQKLEGYILYTETEELVRV